MFVGTATASANGQEHQSSLHRRNDGIGTVYDGVPRAWNKVRLAVHDKNFEEVLRLLPETEDAKTAHGVRNLFEAAAALCRTAVDRVERGDPVTGFRLAQYAAVLAPELPTTHYTMASTAFAQDRGRWSESIGYVVDGWLKEWGHVPGRAALLGRTAATLLLAHIAVLLLFGFAVLRRHIHALSHDASHLFPRGVSSFQAGIFVLLVLLAPLYAGLGMLALFLLWIVATWWYQTRSEKAVTILLLLGTLLMPALAQMHQAATAFHGGRDADVYRCAHGACSEHALEGMQNACREDGHRPSCIALALVQARQGHQNPSRFDWAVRTLKEIEASGDRTLVTRSVLLGNALQAKAISDCEHRNRRGETTVNEEFKDFGKRAIAAYERACSQHAVPLADYNRSLMMRRLGQEEAADELRQTALDSGDPTVEAVHARVNESSCAGPCSGEKFNANILLAWDRPVLHDGPLFDGALSAPGDHAMLPFLHAPLLGTKDAKTFLWVVLGAGALLLLLAALRKRVRPSWRCSQCGNVGCSRCREELAYLDICEECLFIRVKGNFVDAKDLWFRERSVQHREYVRRRTGKMLTFVLPGVGHMFRGRAFAGAFIVFVMTTCLCNATGISNLGPELDLVPHGAQVVARALWYTLAAATYVTAVVSVLRGGK